MPSNLFNASYIKELEQKFIDESFDNHDSYLIIPGGNKLIVSAPHSVTHYRNGKPKQGEFLTGVLSILLNKLTCCHAIIKTKNIQDDPNYDSIHPYKNTIVNIVKIKNLAFLIDLHMMASHRLPEIEIGTGRGKNVNNNKELAIEMKTIFENNGISPVVIDKKFTASYQHTVSSTISRETNIPCIQIELNWRIINLESPQNKFNHVLKSLVEVLLQLEKKGEIDG